MGSLRFALALSVAVFHFGGVYGFMPMSGWVAVEGFFIISGYYMAMVLDTCYPPTRHGTAAFYANRYLRLYPAYLAVLGMTAVAMAAIGQPAVATFALADIGRALSRMDFLSAAYVVFANVTMLGSEMVGFLRQGAGGFVFSDGSRGPVNPAYKFMLIPQGWTLGLELMFYAIAPFVLRLRRGWIVLLLAASLALRFAMAPLLGLPDEPWAHGFFPSILFLFLLGALARRYGVLQGLAARPRVMGVLWAALLVIVAFHTQLPGPENVKYWLFLAGMAALAHPLFQWSKDKAWDVFLGQLSYPLYLCHLLVMYVVDHTAGPAYIVAKIVFSILLALLLYLLIDRNIDTIRGRVRGWLAGKPRWSGASAPIHGPVRGS